MKTLAQTLVTGTLLMTALQPAHGAGGADEAERIAYRAATTGEYAQALDLMAAEERRRQHLM